MAPSRPPSPTPRWCPFWPAMGRWCGSTGKGRWCGAPVMTGGQVIFATRKIRFCGAARSLPATARHARFFQPHAADWLEHLEGLDHIVPAATALAHEAESRLHAWAQAQEPYAAQPMAQRRVVHTHLGPAQRKGLPLHGSKLARSTGPRPAGVGAAPAGAVGRGRPGPRTRSARAEHPDAPGRMAAAFANAPWPPAPPAASG